MIVEDALKEYDASSTVEHSTNGVLDLCVVLAYSEGFREHLNGYVMDIGVKNIELLVEEPGTT